MVGKCSHVGAAGGETGALIGADGRDSRLITISQQFTCLHLWQLREVENVLVGWRLYVCMSVLERLYVLVCLFR